MLHSIHKDMIYKKLNSTTSPQQKYNKFYFVVEMNNKSIFCCAFVAVVTYSFIDN
jgi:hypothetical protein